MTAESSPPTLLLRDGRRLAWHEAGSARGAPVVACHGLPGSREQRYPDEGLAQRMGARVIHVDRPGFGWSDPAPHLRLRDWALDVEQLAEHLGLDRFAVAGVSGGGPFAAACAALLPDRVSRVALVSSVGPPASMGPPAQMHLLARFALYGAARVRWLVAPPLAMAARLVRARPNDFIALLAPSLGPADQVVLARPHVQQMLVRDLREAFRQGAGGLVRDLALLGSDWNLPLSRVRAPCALWHGERDRVVPASASARLAQEIPGSRLTLLPDAGHFFVLEHWPRILEWLLQ